ncbi:hypothetical protein JOB18_000043 [Solea senegalensis]|uniref:Uncharacterized protein n=1 Tax=Solea senegalensis TaxID=28829 RepID=A0AAV6R1J7_SOLSE|nr:hypothetical protein JOB18_000043 [Solea senegalensis]
MKISRNQKGKVKSSVIDNNASLNPTFGRRDRRVNFIHPRILNFAKFGFISSRFGVKMKESISRGYTGELLWHCTLIRFSAQATLFVPGGADEEGQHLESQCVLLFVSQKAISVTPSIFGKRPEVIESKQSVQLAHTSEKLCSPMFSRLAIHKRDSCS